MTDKRREYLKNYREANRERKRLYLKKRRENPEIIIREAKYRESLVTGVFSLYYLPEEHYVGVTKYVMRKRLSEHKNNNKIVEGAEVVCQFKNRREALDAERHLHSIGYNGKNPSYK